jgi:hypothetical protein
MNASLNYIQALELTVTNCQNDKCIASIWLIIRARQGISLQGGANSENFRNRGEGVVNSSDLIDNFLAKYQNLSKIFL